jgi:hypothetical protein
MKPMKRKILFAICTAILCGILTVGLWPFHPPRNDVRWRDNGSGLLFGEYGSILSSGTFTDHENSTACSLEILMRPTESFDSNDLLAFYAPENPLQFRVEQSGDDLFVARDIPEKQGQFKAEHIAIDHLFHAGVRTLITIASGVQGTRIYINGTLVKASPGFAITSKDLTGVLIVANSPVRNYSWAGQLEGLAFYGKELTAAQVMQDYGVWTGGNDWSLLRSQSPIAVYPFNEHGGRVVHNQVRSGSGPDLYIPKHYFVLHQVLLVPPWKEFHRSWGYVQAVLINIGGFIPLGFFFCAYFSRAQRTYRPLPATIVVGGIVSLAIEVIQSFLPTRDSGMTDLITNTSGTALGALLCHLKLAQVLFTKFEARVDSYIQRARGPRSSTFAEASSSQPGPISAADSARGLRNRNWQ